ncbi:MAG: septation protein IspZ [Caulobacteraceae bacterium]|jgi:intracellular septation protein
MADRAPPRWFASVVDGGPGVLFIVAYLFTRDFRAATLTLVIAAAVALLAMLAVERRFRPLPTAVAALAISFGGASLLLRDPQILKMKMSIVDGILGAVLIGGVAMGKNPLKYLLHATFSLPDKAWTQLAIRYGLFWWACAIANEVVRRNFSDHVWVLFRAGSLVAGLVFALAQTPFLIKHNALAEKTGAPPPDLGV